MVPFEIFVEFWLLALLGVSVKTADDEGVTFSTDDICKRLDLHAARLSTYKWQVRLQLGM